MIAAISPHLDDAVLGCGALLASVPGSVVITVFAGAPPAWESVTPWDAACGFSPGQDVIAARRAEDLEALYHLAARPVWLPFHDAQYGPPPSEPHLARMIAKAVDSLAPDLLLFPLGLFHSDHRLVVRAVLPVIEQRPALPACAYEEASYRWIPGAVSEAASQLEASGFRLARAELDVPSPCLEQKRRAVLAYRSQLRGLTTPGRPGFEGAFEPEQIWRLLR